MQKEQARQERTKKVAEYIVAHKATVRETAKAFGISKSTVHEDIVTRLEYLPERFEGGRDLYQEVRKILDKNASERAIRGGMATRKMYKNKK